LGCLPKRWTISAYSSGLSPSEAISAGVKGEVIGESEIGSYTKSNPNRTYHKSPGNSPGLYIMMDKRVFRNPQNTHKSAD
jgi:hypothetical protein